MKRVTGIGGIFIRTSDPAQSAQWYEKHLGIRREWDHGAVFKWREDADPAKEGMTIWSLFDKDTEYFGPDGQALSLVIVDLSQKGLMARCDQDLAREARIQVNLPGIGMCYAVVRWSLGGRIGCELEEHIELEDYHAALSALALGGG